MTGHVTDDELDRTGSKEVAEVLREELAELFGSEVQIKLYQHPDHLDVHVEPVAVKPALEEKYAELTVAPYADFKMTVSVSE